MYIILLSISTLFMEGNAISSINKTWLQRTHLQQIDACSEVISFPKTLLHVLKL